MLRSRRLRQLSLGIGLWISIVSLLILAPQFNHDLRYDLLVQMAKVQGIVASVCGVLFGAIVAMFKRSIVPGIMVLTGMIYGLTIGGTLGFAGGYLLMLLLVRKGGSDELLPGFELAIVAFGLWLLGQSIGAIWGSISWYKWYADRQLRLTNK
jgi:hypothetical protein